MKISLNIINDYLAQQGCGGRIENARSHTYADVRFWPPDGAAEETMLYFLPAGAAAGAAPNVSGVVLVSDSPAPPLPAGPAAPEALVVEGEPIALFSAIQACFLYYRSWMDSLNTLLLEKGSLQDILTLSVPVFSNPIIVDDPSFRTLAISCKSDAIKLTDDETTFIMTNGYHSPDYVQAVTANPVFISNIRSAKGAFVHHYAFLAHKSIYCAIRKKDRVLGFLTIVGHNPSFTTGTIELANQFAGVLATALDPLASQFSAKSRLEDAAILDMLRGKPIDPQIFDVFISKSNLDAGHRHCIARVSATAKRGSDVFVFQRIADMLEDTMEQGGSKLLAHKDGIVILMDEEKLRREALTGLLQEYMQVNKFCIGFSLPFSGYANLSYYYRQAGAAIQYGQKSGGEQTSFNYEDVLLWDILARSVQPAEVPAMLHPALGILEAFDAQKGTVLFDTLRLLLSNGFNTIRTAKQLHLHKNSLYYRTKQIVELTGIDFDDANEREHLKISFYLKALHT